MSYNGPYRNPYQNTYRDLSGVYYLGAVVHPTTPREDHRTWVGGPNSHRTQNPKP